MRVGAAAHAVHTGAEELVQHIVFIGGDHQAVNRQAHHAGHMAGTDIAEIARGHGKTDFFRILRGRLEIACEVVHHLRQQTRPIDRIHRANAVLALKSQVIRHGFDNVLAVVKHAFNGQVVDIFVLQAEHLGLLEWAHPAVGRGHEHPHAFFSTHRVFGGTAGVTRRGTQDVQRLAPAGQLVLKQVAQQLHGHVFERQRGAVGEGLQVQRRGRTGLPLSQLFERHDGLGAVNRFSVGLGAQRFQVGGGNVVDVQRKNFKGQGSIAFTVVNVPQAGQLGGIDLGVMVRQIQTTIGSQAFEQDFTKTFG